MMPSRCRFRRSRSGPRHLRHRRRRGYTLVLFAMLFFCLMALAALVIDLGMARLAQRQMQTAVDSSALEGLRRRDVDVLDQQNSAGRATAQLIVQQLFDDNLDPQDGDSRNFGAGPVYELGPSIGDDSAMAAGQLLSIGGVYKPAPEANFANDPTGDLVAGDYSADQVHTEGASYNRADFAVNPRGSAFLARLRRSNRPGEFSTLDNNDGVSSAGPTMPFLFGRGSLIHKDYDNPNATYSPREHGVTVRATAIAQEQKAKSVGVLNADQQLPGALPLAVTPSTWQSRFSIDSAASVQLTSSGGLVVNGTPVTDSYVVDRTVSTNVWTSLGGQTSQATTINPIDVLPLQIEGIAIGLYVPIIAFPSTTPDANIAGHVIGFGYGQITVTSAAAGTFTLTRRASRIADHNVSAVLTFPLANKFSDSPSDPDMAELLSQHSQQLDPATYSVILAPTLVR